MTVAMETIRSLRAVTPQNTIIEAQHVGQRFTADNGTELTVFDNISFNLYEGEIVAILGRSVPASPHSCVRWPDWSSRPAARSSIAARP